MGMDGRKTVDDLLLPGTPEAVRQRYLTLAQRASTTSFGLLETDIVMLDTETTGLSFRNDELIEIAAARITDGEVSHRFKTFVRPTGIIPAEIQVLTGITHYDVADAPSSEEAVAALVEFVGGLPVIAHNATFDRTFVEQVPGGQDVSDTWIDSLSLSRIALPRLSSHRLADMAEAFGCMPVTHRAMADVDALCGMWRIMLLGLSDLPASVTTQMAAMHQDVPWGIRPLLAQVARESLETPTTLRDVRRTLVSQLPLQHKDDALEVIGDHALAQSAGYADMTIETAFTGDGVVGTMYGTFECRPEQVAMAREVFDAQAGSTHRVIEAGTGVGKSIAYLLPSAIFAQQNNVTVGIATKTNALTDQLVSHELPALDKAMPEGVSYCAIKGYDHYPCLRRVELSTVRALPLDRVEHNGRSDEDVASDMLTAIATVMAYACQSPDGDLDALGIRWRYVPRELLTATHAECLRSRCPYYPNECFVHGARRRAACADVVVTNHSLLLRDIAMDNALLPPIRHWVVDEAHSFEQEARRQWALELSAEGVTKVFSTLGGVSTGVLHALLARKGSLDGSTLVAGLLTKAAVTLTRANVAMTGLLDAIHTLMPLANATSGYDSATLWISEEVRMSDEWRSVELAAATCAGPLEQTIKELNEAREALQAESAQMANELTEPIRTLRDVLLALKTIVLEPNEAYVYSAELYRAKRRLGYERLVAEKLDVGADLAADWYPQMMCVVYTSATLAVGQSFEHFNHVVGLDRLDGVPHKELRVSSSFDYDTNMSVVVARDMPEPNSRSYLASLEDLLFDVHTSMGGSVLTLFTNRREMEAVHRSLAPRLAEAGLELACQERSSSPRRLRERFMSSKSLSLFALKSFWEGFDASGDTLRCVVIPKLPFASPHDPLVRERELREDRSWWRYSLPEAVLAVKQAAGRLIRSSTDTGIVVLADARICTKRYGQTFVRSLPSSNVSRIERSNIGRYITMWRASHE